MKKIKIVFILVLVLLLCGCSGNYNLNIKDNLSVEEEVDLVIEQEENTYENTLKLFENNKVSPKKYKITASDKDVRIKYKEKYDSIEEYILDSKIYRIMFDEISFSNKDRRINIETNSKLLLKNKGSEYITNDLNISYFRINLKTPYKLVKCNADKKENNTYTWNLYGNTKNKTVSFILDISRNKNSINQIIVIVLIFVIVISSIIYLARTFMRRQKME